jgi:pimeloyl-ACP methyl ester carboxylesterase
MPVKERRIRLAGISTAVLHGGSGPPVILLHGPSGYAAHWMRVIPELANAHQVVAPDLPGHGSSYASGVPLDAKRVLDWLGELIDRTCTSPPVLVGEHLGGAIAARFACRHSERIRALVLGDTFGLEAFEPEPKFAQALLTFLSAPSAETHGRLWEHCAFNLPELQKQMSVDWEAFEAYNLDRAQQPTVSAAVHTLMEQFAVAIPPADLSRIKVPTALIWGRHDRATRLQVAEAASARYGWPLIVIEGAADDPSIEQPAAFLQALRRVIGELL